jgi:hypothetical protein
MKFILLSVFLVFFVAMPMYLLNTFVMPELNSMEYTYSHASDIANQAAGITAAKQP